MLESVLTRIIYCLSEGAIIAVSYTHLFPANFKLCEEAEISTAYEDVEEKDLGFMLYDMEYLDDGEIRPMFFRAVMKKGVLDLRDCEVIR